MMKKITLLLMIAFAITLNAQNFYFQEDFSSGDMSNWSLIDADGDGNNWSIADFGAPQNEHATSASWATNALTPDNWMVNATAIDLSGVAPGTTITLRWKVYAQDQSWTAENYTVYVAYGNTVADFLASSTSFSEVLTTSTGYMTRTLDLTAMQGQPTVYLAFRHYNVTDQFRMNLDDIEVFSPFADDLVVDDISAPLTGSSCQLSTETVSALVRNNGTNAITTFDATYIVTNLLSGNQVDSIFETFTIPSLAADASTTINFGTQTSDLSATDSLYSVNVYVSMTNDEDLSSDTSSRIIASIASQDIPYATGFDLLDATGSGIPDISAWGWSSKTDAGTEGSFTPTLLGTANNGPLLLSGEAALFSGNGTDWAFSPCINTTNSQAYRIKFSVRTNQFQSGGPVPEIIEVHQGNGANIPAMNLIKEDSLNDHIDFQEMVYDFLATATSTNIAIRRTTATSFLSVEDFEIAELMAPTASISGSTIDVCTGMATVNFNSEKGNTYNIDWGDGNTETNVSSPVTHTYTATGSQNIVLTAQNLAGSNTANATVDNTLTAADATFTIVQNADQVTVTVDNDLPCNTYSWSWGDGTANASGSSESHTYTSNGTYTIELLASNSAGNNTASEDVVINVEGVDEINFVNGISVFPNPAIDELNINFELNTVQNVNISLLSIDGKVMAETNTNTNVVSETINTSKLSSGLYIVNVRTNEGVYTRNIMVK